MPKIKAGPISADRLKSFIERIELVLEEIKALQGDVRDIYSEAKGVGYDVKTMRKIVQLRAQDPADRDEQEQLLDVYAHALGMVIGGAGLGGVTVTREPTEDELMAAAGRIAAEVDQCLALALDGNIPSIAAIRGLTGCSAGKASKLRHMVVARAEALVAISRSRPDLREMPTESATVVAMGGEGLRTTRSDSNGSPASIGPEVHASCAVRHREPQPDASNTGDDVSIAACELDGEQACICADPMYCPWAPLSQVHTGAPGNTGGDHESDLTTAPEGSDAPDLPAHPTACALEGAFPCGRSSCARVGLCLWAQPDPPYEFDEEAAGRSPGDEGDDDDHIDGTQHGIEDPARGAPGSEEGHDWPNDRLGREGDAQRREGAALGLEREGDVPVPRAGLDVYGQSGAVTGDLSAGNGDQLPAARRHEDGDGRGRALALQPDGLAGDGLGTGIVATPSHEVARGSDDFDPVRDMPAGLRRNKGLVPASPPHRGCSIPTEGTQ